MRHQDPSRIVLIQRIITSWTKQTRDAESSRLRNRLPEMLPLPDNRPGVPGNVQHEAADIYYHGVWYSERNRYQQPFRQDWHPLQSWLPERTLYPFATYIPKPFPHYHLNTFAPNATKNSISLMYVEDMLQIEFYPGKAPSLYRLPGWEPSGQAKGRPEQCALTFGQWMQIRFNLKRNGESTIYSKYAVNVGFADALTPTIFSESSHVYRYTDLAYLW